MQKLIMLAYSLGLKAKECSDIILPFRVMLCTNTFDVSTSPVTGYVILLHNPILTHFLRASFYWREDQHLIDPSDLLLQSGRSPRNFASMPKHLEKVGFVPFTFKGLPNSVYP